MKICSRCGQAVAESGVNEAIAARLKHELEELKKLPGDYFVRHLAIERSSTGLWYRVSEWVEAEAWGPLFASGRLRRALRACRRLPGGRLPPDGRRRCRLPQPDRGDRLSRGHRRLPADQPSCGLPLAHGQPPAQADRRAAGGGRTPRLETGLYLWFEGAKAFKHLPGQTQKPEIEDAYHLASAYRSGGDPGIEIAGVAIPPVKTRQILQSPLRNDYAVLRITRVPPGLNPLPLDVDLDPTEIKRLAPVIALGFPLGRQIQASTVNVSVTQGHVRRSFDNMLQVDTSLHRGNSGGPLIDLRGKVVGIASRVAMDWATGPIPVAMHLPDIGMVLPIGDPAVFYRELAAGQEKWRGLMDLSLEAKLAGIVRLADERRWAEAAALADREAAASPDPKLVAAAAMAHLCRGDLSEAGRRFDRTLSMNPDNDKARLMRFIVDWLGDCSLESAHRGYLLALDWRSPAEFYGYLARILEGDVPVATALRGGDTAGKNGWLQYVAALLREKGPRRPTGPRDGRARRR